MLLVGGLQPGPGSLAQGLAAGGAGVVGAKRLDVGEELAQVGGPGLQGGAFAGDHPQAGELINEDAARLRAAGSFDPGLTLLNPYCLKSPIAPHIAAAEEGVTIEPAPILAAFAKLQAQAELVLVEGVGGFRVPLGNGYDTADLARDLALPVILVVGMRLGCINHALLTAEAIQARGLQLAGWVANQVDPAMLRFEQNLEALTERLPAPLLGVTPFQADGDAAGAAAGLRFPE